MTDPAPNSVSELQEELAKHRERQNKILGIMSDWVWETDKEHRFVWISDKVREITGIPPEWHYGKTRLELLAGGITAEQIDSHRSTLDRHEAFESFTYIRSGPDGDAWLEASGTPQFDEEGEFTGYLGTGRDITNLITARRESKLANDLLSDTIESISAAISVWGPDDRLVLCNQMHREVHADIPEQLIPGTSFEQFILARSEKMIFEQFGASPADPDTWVQTRRAQRDSDRASFTVDFLDGRRHIVKEKVLGDGYVVIVGVDVTELKSSEARLRSNEEMLGSILDALPASVSVVDRKGNYTFINRYEAERWGYDRDSAIGKRAYDFLDESISAKAEAEDREIFETGVKLPYFEENMIVGDREHSTLIEKIPITGGQGAVTGVCMIGLDITDRVKAKNVLKKSNADYRRTLMLLPDAAYITIDGTIVFSNQAANRLFGVSDGGDLRGMDSLILFHPDEWSIVREDREAILQLNEYVENVRRRHVRLDGSELTSENSAAAITWEGENALITVIHDITEQIRTNDALVEANQKSGQANIAKSEFLASMSHEIRTPLNGILGMTNILLSKPQSQENREYIQTIGNSGKLLLTLLNDILDLSKIEAGYLELENIFFDLPKLLNSVGDLWQPKASAQGLGYTCDQANISTPILHADPTRIRQILFNFLSNALKFTAEGEVEIRVSQSQIETSLIETRFDVRDTGEGIPQETQGRLFKKFSQADSSVTRKHGGTGLGLAISKNLAIAMGGNIGVESILGEGTAFWFTIVCPPGIASSIPGEAPNNPAKNSPRPLHLLVAEDNHVNQKIIAAILQSAGHSLDLVGNGYEAVEAASRQKYDLVLMDIQMPEMDGVTAMQKIRELGPQFSSVPIIALTANAMKGDREKYLEAGANDYVSKPIDMDNLFAVMQRLCSSDE